VQNRLALAAQQKKIDELQKQQALDASNAARAEALRCAKEAEKRRQEELIMKQKADEQRMKEMKEARAREHAIKQEIQRLSKQDKLDAVERLRRQDEVSTCALLLKVHFGPTRVFAVQIGRKQTKNERRWCAIACGFAAARM
jgi:hypothetical protein